MNWEVHTDSDKFIKLGNAWVRISRIESIDAGPKQWGTTAKGTPLFKTRVTLFSGATFSAFVEDPDALVRSIMQVGQ